MVCDPTWASSGSFLPFQRSASCLDWTWRWERMRHEESIRQNESSISSNNPTFFHCSSVFFDFYSGRVSRDPPSSERVCSSCVMILMLKVIWATKPVKAIETLQLSLLVCPCFSFCPFYCILSYLLTNMKYSLREFISLVTNTEPNNSAFVYNDVYLYMTTSFLLPVCFIF